MSDAWWNRVYLGSCERMAEIPDASVHCIVTSPPYYGLRAYLPDDAPDKAKEIGLEPTLAEFIERLCCVFDECRRVLRDDGVMFVNMGDSYNAGTSAKRKAPKSGVDVGGWLDAEIDGGARVNANGQFGLKPKDLMLVPYRLALALQERGWWVRDNIVWCLSPSTRVYARTQKGDGPHTLHDLIRLDPSTVQLWNGKKWTRVLGWGPTRCETPIRFVLRSGEAINATPNHEWPLVDGRVVRTDALQIGNVIATTRLPEPDESVGDDLIDLAWFAGLYLAEGSRSDDAIQLAGNASETTRMERVDDIVHRYGGRAVVHIGSGQSVSQVVHGAVLDGALRHFLRGRTSHDKRLHPRVWKHSNAVLRALLDGYLTGDGHDDPSNDRWRLGFTKNDGWADDLRTLAARLGATLTLNPSFAKMGRARVFEAFRGEIRFESSVHWSTKDRAEIVRIEKAWPGEFIDVSVEDEPHLFALASGVLTHNCKPNPMPSSVTDRCTPAHEAIFMLAKSGRYFADMDAVREPLAETTKSRIAQAKWRSGEQAGSDRANGGTKTNGPMRAVVNAKGLARPPQIEDGDYSGLLGANLRNVWTIATEPYSDAHFATFPREIPARCIRIGTSEAGCCAACGAPQRRVVDVEYVKSPVHGSGSVVGRHYETGANNFDGAGMPRLDKRTTTICFEPSCECGAGVVPCTVLDPFGGSGTTAEVAESLGRRWALYELNPEYAKLIAERTRQAGLFAGGAG